MQQKSCGTPGGKNGEVNPNERREVRIYRFFQELLMSLKDMAPNYSKIVRAALFLHEHPTQRPCYQRGSPSQDPAGNRTTRRPPDHCKETQTAVVWSCLPFIRSGQYHLARHSERGKKTRQRKRWEDNIREWTGLEFAKSQRAVANRETMEETGGEIICGVPTTLAVKG